MICSMVFAELMGKVFNLQHGVALHSRADYNNSILLSLQNHISLPASTAVILPVSCQLLTPPVQSYSYGKLLLDKASC